MKIKIETNNGLRFSDKETSFLEFLQADPDFEKYVRKIRTLTGVPENVEGKKESVNINEYNKTLIKDFSLCLVNIYDGLPEHWYTIFENIIMTGVAIPSEYKQTDAISYSLEENPLEEPYRKELRILIHTKISRKQLKHFIDNTFELDELLGQLPEDKGTKTKHIGLKNQISNTKKVKTYSEIADDFGEQMKDIPINLIPGFLKDEFNMSKSKERFDKTKQKMLKKNYEAIKILDESLAVIKQKINT